MKQNRQRIFDSRRKVLLKIPSILIGASLLISGMMGIWHLQSDRLELNSNFKFEPTAANEFNFEVLYSTYLGDSSYDSATAIAIDNRNAMYITGNTMSSNFPTQNALYDTLKGTSDAFVIKINQDGSLNYSTYLGGSDSEYAQSIKVDNLGAVYVIGYTLSTDFPTCNALKDTNTGQYDVFLTKINPDGSLNYSTYLGGDNWDAGFGIAFDNMNAVYITGFTGSSNFPTFNAMNDTINGYYDIFLTKINMDGSLNYSTFLGGGGHDQAYDIEVDAKGAVYLTGTTQSSNFPTQNAIYDSLNGGIDIFVTKLNPDGSLNYSTFLGGNEHMDEQGLGIAIDMEGGAYITGYTDSPDFPTKNAIYSNHVNYLDAFVTKINPDGSLNFSTYLGGSSFDYGKSIAVDKEGAAYATGRTSSSNFPVLNAMNDTNNGGYDFFITKFNRDGTLNYSTYFGGNNYDEAQGIQLDTVGNVYLAGYTYSTTFPVKNALNNTHNGLHDVCISKLGINSPPSVSNVKITPTSAYTMHDLELSYDFIDPDWDSEGDTEIIWYRNGIEQPGYENETIIYAADTEEGDIWNCTIRPFDGTEFGELVWSPNRVILVNDIPTFSRIPNNLTYVFGTTGHLLYWTVNDVAFDVKSIKVTINNEPYDPNKLTVLVHDIMVNVEFLDIGFYEFNLTYNDGLGGEVSSIVSVTVVDRLPPTLWERFLQLLPIIGLGAALIAVGAFVLINKLKIKKI